MTKTRLPATIKNMKLSIVIPVYNEGDVLYELHTRLHSVMKNNRYDYEIIFIDDGSNPTPPHFEKIMNKDEKVSVLTFSRNFGHQAAISAGLDHAIGDAVVIMDGDLQDPPEVIPMFVKKWNEGFDVVYGVRKKRKEGFLKRASYYTFYRLMGAVSTTRLPLDSGDFALMSRQVVHLITTQSMPEHNRYVRGLRAWVGFNQIGVEYERDARIYGEPKVTVKQLFKLAYDGLFSFSNVPIKFMTMIGFFCSIVASLGIIIVLYKKINGIPIAGYASIAILILFFAGVQLLCLGILSEYISRITDEVRRRPQYIVKNYAKHDKNN